MKHHQKIAHNLKLSAPQVQAIEAMHEDGSTIPFMARYRKEKTGACDEVTLREVVQALENHKELVKRRESIYKSLEERELLTDTLKKDFDDVESLKELEDLYSPYRPKRKTRATIAKDLGLEPFAKAVFLQYKHNYKAETFIKPEIETKELVWAGVRDIIAEWIADKVDLKKRLRDLMEKKARLVSKVIKKKEKEATKFSDYFQHQDVFHKVPSHRLHAMLRGKKEGFLRLSLEIEEREALNMIQKNIIKGYGPDKQQIELAIEDTWNRLLHPSIENELINDAKQKADFEAIDVFSDNLKTLLMEAPLGSKNVLAIDPGFRTGCKSVCLDQRGKFLKYQALYFFGSADQVEKAKTWVTQAVSQFNIEVIAIGNGTASRETEAIIKELNLNVPVVQVSESGASIYSASDIARQEFPDLDLTVRGAISIGRRLQDPLAELVKLDPKSIGVGQYQHDVDQKALQQRLDLEIESCVNAVGVELNTASSKLLTHISGLGPKLAESIVEYREKNGGFQSRKDLLNVPRLGSKAFEQCAGFIRIRNASNPLDASGVHPESYNIVEKMAKDQNSSVGGLLQDASLRNAIDLKQYTNEKVGLPTLQDILEELSKPGRDPRAQFEVFQFDDRVQKPEDLRPGMELPGVVTNVTKFGAFVDIGVHQDGLVHISQMANHFVDDPNKIVKVQKKIKVWVTEVDLQRKRIGLSMKGPQ